MLKVSNGFFIQVFEFKVIKEIKVSVRFLILQIM